MTNDNTKPQEAMMNNETNNIGSFKIDVDTHPGGIIESYGVGVALTDYDTVYIGRGRSARDAASDALEMMAQDVPNGEGCKVDLWGMDRIEEAIGDLSDDETASFEAEEDCFAEYLKEEGDPDSLEARQLFYDSIDETFELSAALFVRFGDPEDKEMALARFLDVSLDDVEAGRFDTYGADTFDADGGTFLVCSDSEADDAASEAIAESLWAFEPTFLQAYVPDGVTASVLQILQEAQSEDCNSAILAMVGDDFDRLAEDAIGADGRGHFLSGYDGEENEADGPDGETVYIYRTN
jgi:hypothetical protein